MGFDSVVDKWGVRFNTNESVLASGRARVRVSDRVEWAAV